MRAGLTGQRNLRRRCLNAAGVLPGREHRLHWQNGRCAIRPDQDLIKT